MDLTPSAKLILLRAVNGLQIKASQRSLTIEQLEALDYISISNSLIKPTTNGKLWVEMYNAKKEKSNP